MPPEPNPESIGPYRVEALIGRAGQTAVYRCLLPGTSRPVAVKLFPRRLSEDTALGERFRAAVASLKALTRHPGLVQILDSGQEGDRPYLAMEWVEGTSLDRLTKARRLTLTESLSVMKGICRTLAHAHGQDNGGRTEGRIHGGLTPRNVLVSPDLKTIKISDLGLAPFESATPESLTSTLGTGEIRLGALYYLAPEVIEGASEVDGRADLYSAGAIFHELLTGRRPGATFDLPSVIDAELPQEVDPLPLKALARRPQERYGSATELLREIERVEEELHLRLLSKIKGPHSPGQQRSETGAGAQARRSPLPVLALVSLVLVALGVLGYFMMR
jgi:serine/threonine-protein kinase